MKGLQSRQEPLQAEGVHASPGLIRPAPDKANPPDARRGVTLRRAPLKIDLAVPQGFGFSLFAYLLSRVPVVLGTLAYIGRHPQEGVSSIALRHDGWWYIHIAEDGYSTSLRPVLRPDDFHHRFSEWAFYPGFPLLVRGTHVLTTLSYLTSSLVLASVLGFTAVWSMYALAHSYGGAPAARGAALLLSAWPGAAAFSLPYSEGLFITAAALTLMHIRREQWLGVAACGSLALITRPTGLALLATCIVVAVSRLHHARDWRPLAAAALIAGSGGAFVLYGWAKTGDALAWRHAENLWGQRLDLSTALLRRSAAMLTHPRTALRDHAHQLLLIPTLAATVGMFVLLLMGLAATKGGQWRSLPMATYAVSTVAMMIGYSSVAARPRMVLAVLPGFVWLAVWLPRRVTIGLSVTLLIPLGVLTYMWSGNVTP